MSEVQIETKEIEQKNGELLTVATDFVVESAQDYATAADIRKQAKAHVANVRKTLDDPKRKAKAAHAAICDLEKQLLAPANEVIKLVDQKMLAWNAEQERIQTEAQAKLDELARKEAEAEQIQRLRESMSEGEDNEKIAQIISTPVVVEAPQLELAKPKAAGVTVRKTWKGECTSFEQLVYQVADGKLPLNFLQVNQRYLDEYAKDKKKKIVLPGYETYEKSSMAGTR